MKKFKPYSFRHPLKLLIERYTTHYPSSLADTSPINTSAESVTIAEITKLINQHTIDPLWITQTLSEILGIPWIDLDDFDISEAPLRAITENLLRRYPLLPLWQRNGRLYCGVANPFENLMEIVRFHIQRPVSIVLVEKPKLEVLRKRLLMNPELPLQSLRSSAPPEKRSVNFKQTIHSMEDPPLVRYVNQLLEHAIEQKASDIHFEPKDSGLTIRFRIDGILYPQPSPPQAVSSQILSRLKIMSQLDITENRLPQDGRFTFLLPENSKGIDCRVSSCPTLQGEKIAIRLLDTQTMNYDIQSLGFNSKQYKIFLQALKKQQGMILVTGPTGSGKTVTLYSGLSYLNTESVNIYTAEDPIEVYLPGINQVNIHPKIGLHFSELLKVFLRQDPDIIMFGEMRSPDSAHIGIQAAQTGHLVLSTIHTNSASETITRLVNMGIPHYQIASSLTLIVAQRLVRRLCNVCKEPALLGPTLLAKYKLSKSPQIFKAVGCKQCKQGYQGRIGIFEILPILPDIAESILQGKSASYIHHQAVEQGMLSLKEAAFEKLIAGVIDLAAIDHIT